MFWIPHRKKIFISSELGVLRISIRYWLGWPTFSILLLWNYVNIESGYGFWINVSNGLASATTREKLLLSEICAVFGLSMVLWLTTASESVVIDSVRLRVRKEVFGIGWYRNFELVDVKDIRAGWSLDPKANGKWNPDHMRAALYFDCESKIHSFGKELTTSDAMRIEQAIRSVFPQIVLDRG